MQSKLNNFWTYLIAAALLLVVLMYLNDSAQKVRIHDLQWSCTELNCDVIFQAENTTDRSQWVRFYVRAMRRVGSDAAVNTQTVIEHDFEAELSQGTSTAFSQSLNKTHHQFVDIIQVSVAIKSN